MKTRIITSFTMIVLLSLFCVAGASSSAYESTPMEQDDVKTIDQVNDERSTEFDADPIEQDDVKSIDQVNDERSSEFDANPIEQNDMKTIDQINQ
jgi:hypothetical protein